MGMFGRFTERSQKVIVLAQDEAKTFKHSYVGTEHILLGLIKEGNGIAYNTLKSLGVDEKKLRNLIESKIGYGSSKEDLLGFTPRTKRVFELSIIQARDLGHNYVGTEHLLLGLIREGEGVAGMILKSLGIDLEKTREEIIKILGGNHSNPINNNVKKYVKTPTLDKYSRDLTIYASEGKLDPVIGREKEIERVIQVLSRRTKNNPCLIGEPGVGKTAIAEGLAQEIDKGIVPEILKNKRVVTLDLASMVAGAKYRGEFEDRLKKVMEEVNKSKEVILFIDEIHTIIGAGGSEGAIDASNILKPSLARGEIQVIGATTLDEYRKRFEKDSALERRFQPITIQEPSVEDTIKILQGLRDRYEAHHRVKITDDAIKAASELSHRYITDRFLPDKAIDLVDEAASKIRIMSITAPSEFNEIEKRLEELANEKEESISSQNYELAASLRDEEKKLKIELESKKEEWEKDKTKKTLQVTDKEIAHIVSQWTGIPVKEMTYEESERLLNLESILHDRVIGQEQAVKAVANAVRRARVGLKDPNKPIGSFIFLGPTGVGKTELSKALSQALFGDDDAIIRIDMSEYMEKHSVSRLIGSPPGYIGHDEGGQLTEKVRRKPYSTILFDEIEKAHPDVFNILLQLLDDGRLTDSKGRTVNFKNTVIIMTSNVGASTIKKQKSLGFSVMKDSDKAEYEKMKDNVLDELKKTFRPEFLNRIDEVIVFHQLSEDHIKEVVELMINKLQKRLNKLNINIKVTDKAKDYISKEGYDITFGARPLERSIRKLIEDTLSEEILKGNISKEDYIVIDYNADKLTFNKNYKFNSYDK